MHLHANSMNILSARLQAESVADEKADANRRTADVRRKLQRGAFLLNTVNEDGLMVEGWDGDARRQPGRQIGPQPMRAVPTAATAETEPKDEPFSLWA